MGTYDVDAASAGTEITYGFDVTNVGTSPVPAHALVHVTTRFVPGSA